VPFSSRRSSAASSCSDCWSASRGCPGSSRGSCRS
jgi:hypothetical protein